MLTFRHLLHLSLGLFVVAMLSISSCSKDDDGPGTVTEDPISSFQFEISSTNYLEVTFSNFSLNATSYAWSFGDGNTSTAENPTHTYTSAGDFMVELTATNADGKTHSSSKSVTITDPNSAIKDLTGDDKKVWKLSRDIDNEAYPLIVGPADRSQIWWAYGLNDPIGSRVCMMEEEYIFHADMMYEYDAKGLVFADYGIWNVDVEGNCVDETDGTAMKGPNGEDLTPWGSGSFSFDYDASAGTLKLIGLGAHVGLPKVSTTAEVSTPQSEVTYTVVSLETEGPVDKMVLETTIDGGYWQFNLVSYDDPNDEPDLPGAPPTAAFTYDVNGSEVTFSNASVNADSYMWDFGDGNMSTEENPVHTYASDGTYQVVMTATNANGNSERGESIVISSSVFSADVIHGGGDKTWKLSPTPGSLAVGPSKGSSEWWTTSQLDVDARTCAYDDDYNFNVNGTYTYATNGDLWAEPYMDVDPPACIDDSELSVNAAEWGSGVYSFEVTEKTMDDPAYVTVTGTGAFIGLSKAFNGGEYASGPPEVDGSIQYEVLSYVDDGTKETLVITVDISAGQVGGAYWTFTLISE